MSCSENKLDNCDCGKGSTDIQEVNVDNILDPQIRIKMEKALTRKLDLRLMPTIVLIYMLNYIDRSAVTAARLQGLERDLGLSGIQYNVVLAVLYVTYCPMQIPSNMFLNKVSRPSLYIGTCVVFWGIASALTGITKNYIGIIICRMSIGIPEAAFYPGAMYLLSRWYTRKELALRASILYCGLLTSNAFGSLIAAGILGGMDGARGLPAWRWLFYIEGSITAVFGLVTVILLPDYPHNTHWLSASESRLAQVRLAEEAGETDHDTSEDSAWAGFKMAISDAKVWLFMLMALTAITGASFYSFFPTLTATLGFSTKITLLLAAPPWIIAVILCLFVAYNADRTGERFFHFTSCQLISMLGYILATATSTIGGRYFSLFLLAASGAGTPLIIVWLSNTISRPPSKRAAAIGLTNGVGNIGTIIGSFVWKAQWGPAYHQSMIISCGAIIVTIFIALLIRQILVRENRILDAKESLLLKGPNKERVEEFAKLEGISFEEALVKKKGFRYLY